MVSGPNTIEELTPEKYAFMIDQAVGFETIPNDIRVWDRYLFSKCTTAVQAWRLVQIYVMLKMVNVDYVTVGQWCDQGDFVEKALEKLRDFQPLLEYYLRCLNQSKRVETRFPAPPARQSAL